MREGARPPAPGETLSAGSAARRGVAPSMLRGLSCSRCASSDGLREWPAHRAPPLPARPDAGRAAAAATFRRCAASTARSAAATHSPSAAPSARTSASAPACAGRAASTGPAEAVVPAAWCLSAASLWLTSKTSRLATLEGYVPQPSRLTRGTGGCELCYMVVACHSSAIHAASVSNARSPIQVAGFKSIDCCCQACSPRAHRLARAGAGAAPPLRLMRQRARQKRRAAAARGRVAPRCARQGQVQGCGRAAGGKRQPRHGRRAHRRARRRARAAAHQQRGPGLAWGPEPSGRRGIGRCCRRARRRGRMQRLRLALIGRRAQRR